MFTSVILVGAISVCFATLGSGSWGNANAMLYVGGFVVLTIILFLRVYWLHTYCRLLRDVVHEL